MDVAFAYDSKCPDDSLGCGSEIVELSIGESLGWGDNDAVAGVNAHGIEILHVADYCAVVVLTSYSTSFHLSRYSSIRICLILL